MTSHTSVSPRIRVTFTAQSIVLLVMDPRKQMERQNDGSRRRNQRCCVTIFSIYTFIRSLLILCLWFKATFDDMMTCTLSSTQGSSTTTTSPYTMSSSSFSPNNGLVMVDTPSLVGLLANTKRFPDLIPPRTQTPSRAPLSRQALEAILDEVLQDNEEEDLFASDGSFSPGFLQ